MSNNFVHLHLHSEHSLLDGLGKVDKIFEKAKSLNHSSIAITDHGNLDCYVKAIQASEKYGIKYIPGCEFYIVDNIEEYSKKRKKDEEKLSRLHMTVWAKNIEGVRTIFRLLNVANKKFAKGRPNLEWIDIKNEDLSNVIVGAGCAGGIISRSNKDFERILDLTEDVFIEVMPHQMKMQIDVNKIAEEYSHKYNIPIIATCDAHYVEKDHYYFQEVLLAIQSKTTWDNPDRWRFDINDLYLKSEEEVIESFLQQKVFSLKQIKNYINNTQVVAEMSKCVFKPIKVKLPKVLESDDSSEDILIEHTIDGFHRLQKNNNRMKKYESDYIARIEEELSLIVDLGFEEYFLLVEDLIRWAKSQNILVGPGRGSVGGSLVAYCLSITNVDPLEYDLLFARFISPARIDLPDIDMDFEDSRRNEIKSYLIKKYGNNRVVAVSTFLEMHGRGALRDVARVFKVPLADVDAAAKSIVVRSGGDVRAAFTIKDAFTVFEEGKTFYKKYKEVSDVAMALEGCIKSVGIHAAGIVISTKDFDSGYQGYLRKGARGDVAINWDKEDLEYMGLMKLDILGLNVLTILNKANMLVKERIGKSVDFYNMKFNDKKVFNEFKDGNTVGIFQFGSYGIRKLCTEIKVENFDDLTDINALFRPGTLRSGLVTEYCKRKSGEVKVNYIHPAMKELTKDTYGIILYQEQIMNLLFKLGGLTWKTTDMVRKVVSKSKGEEQFMKFKQMFIDGCLERKTLDKISADKVFEELKYFGCLTGDTTLYRVSSNQYTTRDISLKEAYEYQESSNFKFRRLNILSMWEDGRVRYNKIERIISTGKKSIFYIQTASGKNIKASGEHKFLINNVWKRVTEISVGDWIRCSDLILPKKVYGVGVGKGNHEDCPRFREGQGVTNEEKEQKEKLIKIYKGKCQRCGSIKKIEMHHVDGDHENNNDENTMLLCRKCYKEESPRSAFKRFTIGYHTQNEQIVKIVLSGERETYDIEMEDEPRNFIANGFVSHNSYGFNKSHSVEYAMIAYWCMFMKVYYPAEFFESLMTWGSAEHKLQIYIDEMKRMGFNIHPIDIKKSFGNKWHIEEKDVYPPVSVLKGIGDKASIAFDDWKSNSKIKDIDVKDLLDVKSRAITSRVKTILDGGGAFSKKNINYQLYPYSWETKRDMDKLFNLFNKALELKMLGKGKSKESNWYFAQITETKFGYHQKVKKQTQDLKSVLGLADALGGVYGYARDKDGGYQMITFKGTVYQDKKYAVEHSAGKWALFNGNVVSFSENIIVEDIYFEDEIMECNFNKDKIRLDLYDNIKIKPIYNIQECYDCELRKECSKPVPSEYRSNVLIVGEAPGASEDKSGINFIGAAGELLWKLMYKFGLKRRDFSIINTAKCYPSSTKNPKAKHIGWCKKWFDEDIKAINPIIVLTLGRIATEAMLGEPVKITEASGKVFWSREYLCWVVPSIHPAAVKRGAFPEKDLENFIDFFVGKLETFISKEV